MPLLITMESRFLRWWNRRAGLRFRGWIIRASATSRICRTRAAAQHCSPSARGLTNAQKYIDPAYNSPICSQAVQHSSTANSAQFLSDSILSPEAALAYPNTVVHFLWGGQDLSSAPVMGQAWQQAITDQLISPSTAFACVADAPHTLPDMQDAAARIVTDMTTNCH